ncbi:hypothetical protein PO124_22370 [Bacillus licheniformis]|nr:hypothetical protein [Bacillus licheniformis]
MGLITVSLNGMNKRIKGLNTEYMKGKRKETLIDTVKGKEAFNPLCKHLSDASYKLFHTIRRRNRGKGTDYVEPKVFPSGH